MQLEAPANHLIANCLVGSMKKPRVHPREMGEKRRIKKELEAAEKVAYDSVNENLHIGTDAEKLQS
jgi:hypothetical protein